MEVINEYNYHLHKSIGSQLSYLCVRQRQGKNETAPAYSREVIV